jgi:hypothetical protein
VVHAGRRLLAVSACVEARPQIIVGKRKHDPVQPWASPPLYLSTSLPSSDSRLLSCHDPSQPRNVNLKLSLRHALRLIFCTALSTSGARASGDPSCHTNKYPNLSKPFLPSRNLSSLLANTCTWLQNHYPCLVQTEACTIC